jgi:hypothetical protein
VLCLLFKGDGEQGTIWGDGSAQGHGLIIAEDAGLRWVSQSATPRLQGPEPRPRDERAR